MKEQEATNIGRSEERRVWASNLNDIVCPPLPWILINPASNSSNAVSKERFRSDWSNYQADTCFSQINPTNSMKMGEQFIRAWINPRNVSVARRIEVDTIPKEAYSPFLAIHLIPVTFDRRRERTSGIIGLVALLHEFLLSRIDRPLFYFAAGSS